MRLSGASVVLDTTILVHIFRGKAAANALSMNYGLTTRIPRPTIPVVVKGEIKALARRLKWGGDKLQKLDALLLALPHADISSSQVLAAYADLDCFCVENGKVLSKNDLWIASIAHVTGATLMTTDKDFLPLWQARLIAVEYIPQDPLMKGIVP